MHANPTKTTEVTWKLWTHEEAYKLGVTPHALRMRIFRGKHPSPKIRKLNARVWFVIGE